MTKMSIRRIILFGGTSSILDFAREALSKGFEVYIFTDKFRLDATINTKGTLRKNFKIEKIDFIETNDITEKILRSYVDEHALGLSVLTFWIFRKDVIQLFQGNLFNYHGASLPDERGGGTFTWKILARSRKGCLTIHKIDEGIDTGEICLTKKFSFPPSCRIPSDFFQYYKIYEQEFFHSFLAKIKIGMKFKYVRQKESQSLYWPLLNTGLNGYINWDWSVDDIELFINAFDDPYPGATTFYEGKKIRLKRCYKNLRNEGLFHPFQSGIIFRIVDQTIYIACNKGSLIVKEMYDDQGNKNNQIARVGVRFYTPSSCLDQAKETKVRYDSKGLKTG